ncbi:MAG: PadR family transcriptional regulator [Burkholderiaceae bacterium]|nr:PadR family transcriptional regulator [Burkholderiaceae bacterium]
MSLPHALLTALLEQPGSGSDLAQRFDRSIGHFWNATHQQIYRELARLQAHGLVQSHPIENTRGRKRAYRILPAGRQELARWVGEPAAASPLRDALMVRLRAEALVGPTALVDEIRQRLQAHRAQLELYLDIERRDFPPIEDAEPRPRALQHLVLHAGILYERNWIDVLEQALGILDQPVPRPRARSRS